MKEKDKISKILLEAIWVTDSIEAIGMIERIFEELDKSGYEIVKKKIK